MDASDWIELARQLREQARYYQRRPPADDIFTGLAEVSEKMAQREIDKQRKAALPSSGAEGVAALNRND